MTNIFTSMLNSSKSHKITRYGKRVFSGLAITTLCGCANTSEFVSVNVLHQSPQCGIDQEGIEKLEQEAQLKQIVNHGMRPANKEIPNANFELQHVISISMGMKPSSGYSLSLQTEQAKLENDSVHITIDSTQPSKNSMNAMVMTSPCLVLSIDKGNYSKVIASPYTLILP